MTDAATYAHTWLLDGTAEAAAQTMLLPFLISVALLRVILLMVMPPKALRGL